MVSTTRRLRKIASIFRGMKACAVWRSRLILLLPLAALLITIYLQRSNGIPATRPLNPQKNKNGSIAKRLLLDGYDKEFPTVHHLIHQNHDSGASEVNLMVVGDWGGSAIPPFSTPIQRSVAAAIGDIAKDEKTAAILTPGDVMYEAGATGNNDPRFNLTFEKVFTHPSLNIPWYIVAGNHDHFHSIKPLIHYTFKSERWVFPSSNYLVNMEVSPGSPSSFTVTILMVDTWSLCGATGWSPPNITKARQVWAWIKHSLKKNKSAYIFIVGHYPTLSIGRHGPTPCLKKRLTELMAKFRATAYFSGHDHNLQHITSYHEGVNWTLHHFVVGAGAKPCGKKWHQSAIPKDAQKFFHGPSMKDKKVGGFGRVKLLKDYGYFSFTDSNKKMLYQVKLEPRPSKES